MSYVFEDETCDDNMIRRYPGGKPYVQRDQGVRPSDETIMVVLDDIADVLDAEVSNWQKIATKARELATEATNLDDEDEFYFEHLNDILQQAEQLDHVYVEWNGDAGTVTTTISDYWYEVEASDEDD